MKKMFAESNEGVTTTLHEILPRVGERVIVECEGFRCLGFCNPMGHWVDAYNNQVLNGVISFKPLNSNSK